MPKVMKKGRLGWQSSSNGRALVIKLEALHSNPNTVQKKKKKGSASTEEPWVFKCRVFWFFVFFFKSHFNQPLEE
jgi:hypothetical protein